MNSPATALRRRARSATPGIPDRIAQAVRNSLNLPGLNVEARRGRERGCWQVRLKQGADRSEWLTLNAAAVGVIRKLALLPPMLLGQFRLAYDAIRPCGHSERSEETAVG
jgi:hypothetical protein